MSLLTNYEGLRHQIERLVRENEELKKLVRLIRENYELKSAIKTQAGSLGISGFSSGLSEAAASASPHQGVFLPPSPAAANEPILEEVGIVALAPLADVLNSPQPSPVAGPIVSPLAGPLNTLLPGPGPTSQSSPLTSLLSSHLASPLVVPQVGTPTSSLGLPSTGSLMPSNPLAGPMAVPPGGTPTSSLGLPSTGPLTPGSPLVGPLAVSQNGPLMPPMTGSGVLSLNSPLLTSTAAPLGVSQNVLANPMNNLVLSEAPRVRLAEPLRGYPPGPHPSADRGPSATSKVTDARGPRGPEQSRKSILELERKLAHRKSSKFPDSSRESKQLAWERLVGEIAFQLDRRILSSIFPERVRLYGFTVSNIPEKIIQASLNPSDHKLDEELCQTLTQRYVSIMNRLQSLGYNGRVHPALTEQLVNAYGILRERPELAASEGGSYTVDFLQRVLVETVHPSMLTDALLLLSCLSQLAHDDGKPMFIW
ncbi:speriolin isoform X2 [Bos taurus]|uniref:Spermatosis and centriole associated 1 n=1 Tax=Bos taurus TaxID=9913 RepID=F1MUB8_BOVIN|nr:speriolin isoform X2 [Bos taurus]